MSSVLTSSIMPHVDSPSPAGRFLALRLRVFRGVWFALAPLALGAFAAAVPSRYEELRAEAVQFRRLIGSAPPHTLPPLLDAWLTSQLYAPAMLALEILVMLACATAAILLFWRRHDEGMAIMASLSLVGYGALFLPTLDALAAAHPICAPLARAVQAVGLESSLLIFYVLPDGRFVVRWTRPLAILWTGWTVASVIEPSAPFDFLQARPHVVTPQHFSLLWLLILLAWYGTGLLAQLVRYRRISTPQQRQQTKWVLIGWASVIACYAALVFPRVTIAGLSAPGPLDLLYRAVGEPVFEVALLLSPIPITISMLRYRLWDVDVVINRALIYGLVTLALGLNYLVSILSLETVFRWATGQDSPLAIVLSTLACAWLFQPVHRRIQRAVDYRFYRRKYDAARLIEEFGHVVRDDVELDTLLDDLVSVVDESMRPAHASVTLLPPRTVSRPARPIPGSESAAAPTAGETRLSQTLPVTILPREDASLRREMAAPSGATSNSGDRADRASYPRTTTSTKSELLGV